MRANLPEAMRFDLEYRDAIAIAFFAAYMLPQMNGLLVGFGTGNIFRRLNREAPMGAIRRSIRDTMSARSHGMRASGLEDYFADLMREAGALDKDQALRPCMVQNRCICTRPATPAATSSHGIPRCRSRHRCVR